MEKFPVSSHRTDRPAAASAEDDWRGVLANAIRDPAELCRLLGLPAETAESGRDFPMLVPRTYLARIRPGDPHDPLLLQVLPKREEQATVPQFVVDPLGESTATCAPGLLRKYKGRLLILASRTCGVHCRFCFRRHFPLRNTPAGPQDWPPIVAQIAADPSIEEVVLSGGDPLVNPDSQLAAILTQISQFTHAKRFRIHTRLPIAIPQRINDDLLALLRSTRLTPSVVVHVNHPAEIDARVATALGQIVDAGIPVLSQTVLLRGVNDAIDVLAELFGRMIDLRVMPYYLHQLDRVAGAVHFEVPESQGVELIRQLRARLPGYAVPRYVRDTPGAANKEVLA